MNKLPFEKFPHIETERLILRKIDNVKDVANFFKVRSNSNTMYHIPRPPAQFEQDVIDLINSGNEQYEKGEMMSLAIALKDTDEFIGAIGFYRIKWEDHRTEIGYILNPDYSGKGYMHEACKALIKFAFEEIGFHSLEAVINADNFASINVVEKLGFVREAYFKENTLRNGEFIDTVIYSLLNPSH
jgi:ribosomal-protein-alanine N-acetyltransferase